MYADAPPLPIPGPSDDCNRRHEKEKIMCAANRLKMLNSLGMRLAGMGQYKAAITLLALALRQSLRMGVAMQEAKIRNNMALVFCMAGKKYLARRQIVRAMGLVATRVGTDNRFYRVLQANLVNTLREPEDLAELAA